jgi:formate/nitrite transporter FocA (FNT family)
MKCEREKRSRRFISHHVWFHPGLRTLDATAVSHLLDRAIQEARSSPRILWLLPVVAGAAITAILVLPSIFGSSVFPATFAFALLVGAVAHQINLFVAIRQELQRLSALALAAQREA